MNTLYIIRGLPGAGKSTLAAAITANNVAADDYPGLYVNGKYNIELQKASHEWCFQEVKNYMELGVNVVVHNTFVSKNFMQNYLDLAASYGYAVQIIHAEGVLVNDEYQQSTHSVPAPVFESMQQRWEIMRPAPQRGINLKQLSTIFQNLQEPDLIVFDMDNTLKKTKSGAVFAESPEDFVLTPEILNFRESLFGDKCLYAIASNQRGLETGAKTLDFLSQEVDLLLNELYKQVGLPIEQVFVAHKRSEKSGIWLHAELEEFTCENQVDKPGIGLMEKIIIESDAGISGGEHIWIVGDSHTNHNPDDYQFFLNCQKDIEGVTFHYIPIEMLNIAQSLID